VKGSYCERYQDDPDDQDQLVVGAECRDRPILDRRRRYVDDPLTDGPDQ